MRDNELASIRSGMVGLSFKDNRGGSVTVINVTRASNGFSVIFNYGAEHNVFCGLGNFKKRYPHKVQSTK